MNKNFSHGWAQVFVALLVQGVSIGAVYFTYGLVAVSFGETFQADRMVLMLGVTCIMITSGIISPWAGVWLDRYPIKRLMLIGVLCLSGGYLALSFVTAMWQVLIIYGSLIAVATTLAGPLAANTLLVRWFHQRRTLALGIAAAGTSLGGLAFPILLQWLIDSFEWRAAFQILSAIILVCSAPWIILLIVNHPADRDLHPDGAAAPVSQDSLQQHQALHFSNTKAFMRSKSFWAIAFVAGALTAVQTAMLANLVPFVTDSGATASSAALLLSLLAATSVLGKLLFGIVGDRIDLRVAFAGTLIVQCIALGCFLSNQQFAVLALGTVLLGLASGGMLPIWGGIVGQVFGADNYGRAMGLMTPIITLLALTAPPLAGHAYDVSGNYSLAFSGFIVILALATLTLPLIRIKHREPEGSGLSEATAT